MFLTWICKSELEEIVTPNNVRDNGIVARARLRKRVKIQRNILALS